MHIDTEALTSVIKDEIKSYEKELSSVDSGTIVQVGDGIAKVYGLGKCMQGELVKFSNGTLGMALNLEEDSVGCVLLGSEKGISEGDTAVRTGKVAEVPVGKAFLGRVVDALGNPIDNKGAIENEGFRPIEGKAPAVLDRKPVHQPLQTGIKAIDAMIPIGKGQRELIIGDRQIGKTTIALDSIINQRTEDVICIYVAIGQKQSTVANVVNILTEAGAMDYTIVVSASASDPAPLQYIAPYAGVAMAEHFMYQGKDVLIVYDDLSKHAVAYRTLSLLLRRPPGREAYPGDVFYIHSRLLERAAKLSDELGAGSITALPIIETLAGDVSAYIPTNVISITDGQIFLESGLFNAGVKPAVNPGISVSRVGGSAQTKAMKQVAKGLRLDLAQFRELESFAQFGSDLEKDTERKIEKGKRLVEVLKQPQFNPRSLAEQVAMMYAGVNDYLNDVAVQDVTKFEAEFLSYLKRNHQDMMDKINSEKILSKEVEASLKEVITKFKGNF
ncbi:F0F1 ATP synthase subunit alpha [Clostridium massiliamazoniense]|uniref:F0F1 ATP synthase subunit alpha n=1 Tax=Clostridium massiliamazoniense TaxID=1347366 RepID=UPI0006D82568|nr:F0F1 ATP synthase subunit alpha [Clostridium massiliamazoniense]